VSAIARTALDGAALGYRFSRELFAAGKEK